MDSLVSLRDVCEDGFNVEFEIIPTINLNEREKQIAEGLQNTDSQINLIQEKIDEFDIEIDKLTNHADGLDYTVAVACGILTGVIDSFFVGEFNFKKAKAKSNKQVNDAVMKFAKMKGYKDDHLKGAVSFLEKEFPVAQDNIWKGKEIGVGAKNHHLADFAHHPTLLGLAASVLVQFFKMGIFVNRNGKFHFEFIDTNPKELKELIKIWMPVIISGLLNWLVYIVENKYEEKMGEEIPKPIHNLAKLLASAPMAIELLKVANNWIGHLFSDMGGSKSTAGGGMGIPGLFISLLHEMASLPILKDTGLPKLVNDLYVKEKMDMRSELAILNELGRQAIPIIINELFVRGFYFVRHLIEEIKEHESLRDVNWNNVIPFGNRTVERMMTISSSTFVAVDLADAAIRSVSNPASVSVPTFLANMFLRVNFVGIGRCAIAVTTDVGMGIKKGKKEGERSKAMTEMLRLSNTKVYYRKADLMCEYAKLYEKEGEMHHAEADLWIEVQNTQESMDELHDQIEKTFMFYINAVAEMDQCFEDITNLVPDMDELNPGLREKILRRLE